MKKALIITAWSLLGIVATVLIAFAIACYVIFTPARLTAIANQVADDYITCEYEIGEVELTFFSTFPRVGVRADGLLIVNPMEGAQNDTVVEAKHVTATVDVMAFLKRDFLCVHEAILDDAQVHFYIAEDGKTNLTDVFVSSPDEEEDTTAFALPFDSLRVDGLRIKAKAITFVDAKDTIEAALGKTELRAQAGSWDDIRLQLEAHDIDAKIKGETYADKVQLTLKGDLAADLEVMAFDIHEAELALNEFEVQLAGAVALGDTIDMDVRLQTGEWDIESLLGLVPAGFKESLKDLDIAGSIALDATAKGAYSETQMPLVTAHVNLKDGKGAYKPLPYVLRDLTLDADAAVDLNKQQPSSVTINRLSAKTKQSRIEAEGTVDDVLEDMLMDLHLTLDANLPDFAYFMPKEMDLEGRAKGKANAKIRMSDLSAMRLQKGDISADLTLTDIHYAMDSMEAELPHTIARVHIPNKKPSKPAVNWARIDLDTKHINFAMDTTIEADLGESMIQIEVSNVLNKGQDYYASVHTAALNGRFEDTHADMKNAALEAFIVGGKQLSAKLKTDAMKANMGEELKAKTEALSIAAAATYDSKGENILLQWNPQLTINLKKGELNMPERLPETVYIPSIEFDYSNKEMSIANSRIELGRSDLNIKGNVRHIGEWFRHEKVLEGELDIVSDHCDANQLIVWFSDDKGSEESGETRVESQETRVKSQETRVESQESKEESGEIEPFLVPTDVDLALNTNLKEVEIFNQTATDLRGGIFIQDGSLILDEVGFVCRAAKLQLTAMYRSPRRNHLYLGMDYHMIDVDIDELLTMIPNLEEMVPMLSSFKGAAEFHLAAETYLNSQYQPKMSTLRGAASLTAKDLVVLDGKTFDQIAKLLMFKKKTENKIDSINAEITIYKNEIDVYPLCVQMDNYMVALGGRHNTNMTFNYDINVLSPIYLGVNVSGTLDDLQIKLAKCKFAQDFKPHWYQKVDNQSRELRERIKQSMEKNVRIR